MKNWIVVPLLGAVLFVGTTAGLLLVQGRLDYDGTRGVPILSWLFSEDLDELDESDPLPPAMPGFESWDEPNAEVTPAADGTRDAGGRRRPPVGDEVGARAAPSPEPQQISTLFDFPKLDSGVDVAELERLFREAQRRLQDVELRTREIERREQDLLIRERDLSDRQLEVTDMLLTVDQEQQRLDRRLQEFRRDVELVRGDQADKYRDFGAALLEMGSATAAAIIEREWEETDGQRRVVVALASMRAEDARRALQGLTVELQREILVRRLDVVFGPEGR